MAELDIVIKATNKTGGVLGGLKQELSGLSGLSQGVGKSFGGLQKVAMGGLKVAAFGAAGAVAALGVAFSDSVSLAKTQLNAEKQLAAVIESTGGAAGLTADEIKNMASELQNVTNFGDEATIAGQSLLLTFTGIGKETFPRATETMLDMSQALGQDMKSSAIQLGKALNDPISGVSALSRVGVSFTEQQKEQIAAMAEAGNVAGAQGLILDELERQFGGSARAMADPAIQLSNAFGDFKEILGSAVLPIINELAQAAMPYLSAIMATVGEKVQGFIDSGFSLIDFLSMARERIMAVIQPITDVIGKFVGWQDILIAIGVVIASIVVPAIVSMVVAASPMILLFAAIAGTVALLRKAWETDFLGMRTALIDFWENNVQPAMESLQTWASENLPGALETLREFWEEKLLPAIKVVWKFISENLIPLFRVLVDVWFAAIRLELAAIAYVWETVLKPALTALWAFFRDNIIPIFDTASDKIGGVVGAIQGAIGWAQGLADGLNSFADNIFPGGDVSINSGRDGGGRGTSTVINNNVSSPLISGVIVDSPERERSLVEKLTYELENQFNLSVGAGARAGGGY